MTGVVYLSHPSSLAHDTGAHPERAGRMTAIEQALAARGWLGLERVSSDPADLSALCAVHDASYVESIRRASAAGGGRLDADTVVSHGSWDAARHAAGGAVGLVDRLLGGASSAGFSAHRPPGHHAESARAMGFCLFNSVAVGAQHAVDAHGLERVLVLDWDVHHGNGTNDIFHARDDVLYMSIHESPLYPGTGQTADVGAGAGAGYTVNLPVPGGAGDACFSSLVEHVVVPVALHYRPQLVLVSAGYDAHVDDPLASCRMTEAGFAALTGSVRRLCAELEVPLGLVLEGGYSLAALGSSVAATLEVLTAPDPPAALELNLHQLAAAALERLREQPTSPQA